MFAMFLLRSFSLSSFFVKALLFLFACFCLQSANNSKFSVINIHLIGL